MSTSSKSKKGKEAEPLLDGNGGSNWIKKVSKEST
jgi:hypothetical protein